jgi:hypothetical protein
MRPIVDQPSDVILGHLGQLFLEDALEAGQDDCALPAAVVVDDAELDLAIALLDDGGLLGEWDDALLGLWRGVSHGRRRRRLGALLLGAFGGADAQRVVRFALN